MRISYTTALAVASGITALAFPTYSNVHDEGIFPPNGRQLHPRLTASPGSSNFSSATQANDSTVSYWLDQVDRTGSAAGFAPFADDSSTYQVYRNIRSSTFGAQGDGSTDDSDALQAAIDYGSRDTQDTLSRRPALVFVPGGTYSISKCIHMRLNTILVGDPNDIPIIKAASSFGDSSMLSGHSASADPTTNFFMAIKNVALDTTDFDKDTPIVALDWTTSQACQLTNVQINMPLNSGGHTGIAISGGSSTIFSDVSITGGNIGIDHSEQQVSLKGILFHGCTTAIKISFAFTMVVQKATFDNCGSCIDATGGSTGSLVMLDCSTTNSGPLISFTDYSEAEGLRNNQLVIENFKSDGTSPIAVTADGNTVLSDMSAGDTWVWGNPDPGSFQIGMTLSTPRSAELLDSDGNFFTMPQPTDLDTTTTGFVNVKAAGNFTVKGDGETGDSEALNAIIAQAAAAGKIVYVPYGVYILQSTLYIPPGTTIVGECWSTFSGVGDAFSDAENPSPVVMVGNPGETGITQIQDVRFTVADISPGAIILQVNMKGQNAGDVALWNSHVTVGGFADSKVDDSCDGSDTSDCKAAFALVHLTDSSSVYIENMWGWTADHSLDGGPSQNIATGRGLLVEATEGTWLTGTGFEHNTLYNYNLHSASNVFAGMQQCETPYWQGPGAVQSAPGSWTPDSAYADPDWSWCSDGDQTCRMALAQNIDGGSDLFLYGAAFWIFFQAGSQCDDCITNQARVTNSPSNLYWYGVNTKSAEVMVLDGKGNPKQANNPGGWGGVIAAYLQFTDHTQSSDRTSSAVSDLGAGIAFADRLNGTAPFPLEAPVQLDLRLPVVVYTLEISLTTAQALVPAASPILTVTS